MSTQEAQAFIGTQFGYQIESLDLVCQAMDTTGLAIAGSNTRLAVVGDSVLRTAITGLWYPTGRPRGTVVTRDFDRSWQSLASNARLGATAQQIGLGAHLRLHPGHIGSVSCKTLATGLEAVFGAIWRDSGEDMDAILNAMHAIGMDVNGTD